MRFLVLFLTLAWCLPARADTSFEAPYLRGATDDTKIGNTSDKLKVDATGTVTSNQGTQGTNTSPWYINLRNASGTEIGTSGAPVRVDPTGTTTQPISAASLPLPTGASTSANQSTEITALQLIDNPIGSLSGGTAGTSSYVAGGIYNGTLPTLTTGQQVSLQVDVNGRLITSGNVTISSQPAFSFSKQVSINSGTTIYTSYTAVASTAVKQFYAGGTGIGRQTLYRYVAATTQYLNGGNFETAPDVAAWPYFSAGGAGTGSAAISTTQAFTGTHSDAVTFTTSDSNHSNGIQQTFSPTLDISGWRYVTAEFFNTVSAGATYTRTIQITVTDSSGATRTYATSGASNVSPFNTAAWIKITGEIENPTSSTGSAFDPTAISTIELRMFDSANRAGTVYWDTAQLEGALTTIFPIYHDANRSFNIGIDPVVALSIGDVLLIGQRNSDTARKEYFAVASGVNL